MPQKIPQHVWRSHRRRGDKVPRGEDTRQASGDRYLMGGFAVIKIALTRPELFCFVGALSPPIDIAHRQFRIRRWGEWWRTRRIFGPSGSEARRARDPSSLLQTADALRVPYLYITVGLNEPLLEPDRAFSLRLAALHFMHEFHTKLGGHDWNEWNSQLDSCFESLMQHVQRKPSFTR
jgi:putative tributyrin esterase